MMYNWRGQNSLAPTTWMSHKLKRQGVKCMNCTILLLRCSLMRTKIVLCSSVTWTKSKHHLTQMSHSKITISTHMILKVGVNFLKCISSSRSILTKNLTHLGSWVREYTQYLACIFRVVCIHSNISRVVKSFLEL